MGFSGSAVRVPSTVSSILSSTSQGIPSSGESKTIYQKKKVGEDQNHVVKLASIISNNDIDWILTLNQENGLWDMYRKHPYRNKNGTWDYSCGLNSAYHKDMIAKIKAKSVNETQILTYCYSVYKSRKTAFYGYSSRWKSNDQFYLTNI